jgi:hypothetical protein
MSNNVKTSPRASERVKASQIRAKIKLGQQLESDEAAWFADYQAARDAVQTEKAASRARKVSYTEEEHEAVGEGESAAVAAAAGAAMVTADGQRLDGIVSLAMASMTQANQLLMDMTANMMKRTEGFELTLIRMMEAQADLVNQHRENAIRATDAEIRAMEAESEHGEKEDSISQMVKELLPALIQQLNARK